jgi:AP-4 complex subunit mu-1
LTIPGSIKIPGIVGDALASTGSSTLKNEIFVDIIERLNVTVCSNGKILNASIDGCIQMKSYLSGNPSLRLALNDDLLVLSEEGSCSRSSSSLPLDDIVFHESAQLEEFESTRVISLTPPDGEFVLVNYRIANFDKVPFRVFPSISVVNDDRLDLSVVIRADIPLQNYGTNIIVSCPVTVPVRGVSFGDPLSGGEYMAHENRIAWNIKKLSGGQEIVCKCRIHLASPDNSVGASVTSTGPVSLSFEIPMYSISNMQVRYLRIGDNRVGSGGSPTSNANGPFRWVRYVVQSQSYTCRHG